MPQLVNAGDGLKGHAGPAAVEAARHSVAGNRQIPLRDRYGLNGPLMRIRSLRQGLVPGMRVNA